jgi:hypothetical protein
MDTPTVETEPVHFRIYVYDGGTRPPDDEPQPMSLCLAGRIPRHPSTDSVPLVTCEFCLRHIKRYGLDWYAPAE